MDLIAFLLIGLYALGAAIGGSTFSEMHLTLPSLNIPMFLGEVLLAECLLIWVISQCNKKEWTKWHSYFAMYWGFVAAWALWEFGTWGALAFRNAALFYYPIFALFGFSFYRKEYFSKLLTYTLLPILILFTSRYFDCNYFWYTCFILALILIMNVRAKALQIVFLVALFALLKYSTLFSGSRTALMSSLASLGFLVVVFIVYFLKFSARAKTAIGIGALCLALVGVYLFADRNGVKSVLKMQDMIQMYSKIVTILDRKRVDYKPQILVPALYHDNKDTVEHMPDTPNVGVDILAEIRNERKVGDSNYRNFDDAQGNGVFRMLIWHDMYVEMSQTKSFLGVGLGKPQRSISLEMLWWGGGEWSRDGWITPHNVYLHLIYRLGVIGVFVILAILGIMIYLIKSFIAVRSKTGVMLVSILIYWLMASNSLVILELPHYAIPFWSILGLSLAYCSEQLKRHKESV